GLKILMLHGHTISEEMIDSIAASGKYDLVFYGHFHKIRDEIISEKTRVLNPGEACGYLTGKSTAMLLEIDENKKLNVELLEL
ncbi:MAG: metallophosphoesterase family protein, partial [Candidatus Hodarchaeota archaeon]